MLSSTENIWLIRSCLLISCNVPSLIYRSLPTPQGFRLEPQPPVQRDGLACAARAKAFNRNQQNPDTDQAAFTCQFQDLAQSDPRDSAQTSAAVCQCQGVHHISQIEQPSLIPQE
jgi:hypothetical protein